MNDESSRQSGDRSMPHRVFTIVGIVLCVLLLPILVANCVILIKSVANPDEVPDIGGVFPMIVLTDSMSPDFDSGDLIVCRSVSPGKLKVGDVISFFDPDGSGTSVVTHRIERIYEPGERPSSLKVPSAYDPSSRYFETKGIANNTADIYAVPAEDVIGIYTDFHIPNAGHVAMFMQTVPGLVICVLLPLLLLVGYDFLRRRKYDRAHEDDRDAMMRELAELRELKAQREAASAAESGDAPQGE